jgi:hypothetical protein
MRARYLFKPADLPVTALEDSKNGETEKAPEGGYHIEASVFVLLAKDHTDTSAAEFSLESPQRRSEVREKVAKKFLREPGQFSTGKHLVGLPGIRICKKLPHPKVGSLSRNKAYFPSGGFMSFRSNGADPAGETKDSDLKTGKLKRLDITKKPATGHFHAELVK